MQTSRRRGPCEDIGRGLRLEVTNEGGERGRCTWVPRGGGEGLTNIPGPIS